MAITAVTDETFGAEVKESKDLVLVDFWAEWCGPCRMLGPVLDDLDKEIGDSVKVCKVNIDNSPESPTEFGVRSIPTLILFKDGKVLDTKTGVSSKSALIEWINKNK